MAARPIVLWLAVSKPVFHNVKHSYCLNIQIDTVFLYLIISKNCLSVLIRDIIHRKRDKFTISVCCITIFLHLQIE